MKIDNQMSQHTVAIKFKMSTSYLSKVFKDHTGMNFSEFVFERKLEKAAELLVANRKMEIRKIAERLGYLDLSYFSKLFKELYGMTPMQFRKKNIQ